MKLWLVLFSTPHRHCSTSFNIYTVCIHAQFNLHLPCNLINIVSCNPLSLNHSNSRRKCNKSIICLQKWVHYQFKEQFKRIKQETSIRNSFNHFIGDNENAFVNWNHIIQNHHFYDLIYVEFVLSTITAI